MSTDIPDSGGRTEKPETSPEQFPESSSPRRNKQDVFDIAYERILGGMRNDTGNKVEKNIVFDLRIYEELLENPDIRELTPEDLPAIEDLYVSQEVSPDTFLNLSHGEIRAAEDELAEGGLIDRWQSNDVEMSELRRVNPEYIPSGEEFRNFLEGNHGRAADFRVWGLFDAQGKLRGMCGVFVPPHDPVKRRQHGGEIRNFFEGKNLSTHFTVNPAQRHLLPTPVMDDFAELYIIVTDAKGVATVLTEHMLRKLNEEHYHVSDWYLLRFGSMAVVSSTQEGAYVASDAENAKSKGFFRKRGFATCGECYVEWVDPSGRKCLQIAARQTRDDSIVVVHPTWKVMNNSHTQFVRESRDECTDLHFKARERRGLVSDSSDDVQPLNRDEREDGPEGDE